MKYIELKENDLLFAKVNPKAIIPSKEDENAGYDIYACFDEDFIVIPSHSTKLIPTGIASVVSNNYYLQVHERGSTGSKGMKYSAGVIDSSYRGEIFIALSNINSVEIIISKLPQKELIDKYGRKYIDDEEYVYLKYGSGEFDNAYLVDPKNEFTAIIYPYTKAIAQLVVHEVPKMNVKEISYDELKTIPSKRGSGSLGSSGK